MLKQFVQQRNKNVNLKTKIEIKQKTNKMQHQFPYHGYRCLEFVTKILWQNVIFCILFFLKFYFVGGGVSDFYIWKKIVEKKLIVVNFHKNFFVFKKCKIKIVEN